MKIAVLICLLATCLAAPEPEKRIVNGAPASVFAHPYQVSIQVPYFAKWDHRCGGSLIGRNKVLTAAHCLKGETAAKMRVKVGTLNLYETPNAYEQNVAVKSFVIHENYGAHRAGFPNDIGVVTLESDVTLNQNVQIASLAPKNASFVNTKCVISGWGQTSDTSYGSAQLLEAKITAISTDECARRIPRQGINIKHICVYEDAAPEGKRPSSCMGDSGGPMMCGNNFELLAGITSWGVDTCSGDVPSVCTRVSEYLDWIDGK